MNESVIMTGKSVDEAVQKALAALGTSEDRVTVEVLEEESGFLGIGAKAKVSVTLLPEQPVRQVKLNLEPTEEESETPEFAEAAVEVVEGSVEGQAEEAAAGTAAVAGTAADVTAVEVFRTERAERAEADAPEVYDEVKETVVSDEEEPALAEADSDEAEQDLVAAQAVQDFLQNVVDGFGLGDVNEVKVAVEDKRIIATIDGDDCGILIGRRGETLNSLQYLSSLVANRSTHSRMRVSLDIGGYKAKREDSVSSLAIRTAQRAVRTRQAYELTPMNAAERRVVHETLQTFPGVVTYSEGDEPNRYVVIDLAYEDEKFSNDEPV